MRQALLAAAVSAVASSVFGQPVADFSMPSDACLLENVRLTNASTGASEYEWDFCESDISTTPSVVQQDIVSGAVALTDVKIAYDNGWYGFTTDGDGNRVLRLFFGATLENNPAVSTLFDFNLGTGIEIAKIESGWVGLAGSFGNPSRLMLMDFGSSLSNAPTVTEVIVPPGTFNNIRSIRLTKDGDDYVAFVVNWSQTLVTRLNFGTQMTANPGSVDQIDLQMSTPLIGIELAEDANGKYAFVTHFSNGALFRLNFGASWMSSPVIEQVTIPFAIPSPTILRMVHEGGNFFLFLTLDSGQLFRIAFGPDLSSLTPAVDDLGTFGGMTNVRGMSVGREDGAYSFIFTSFTTNRTYHARFEAASCAASIPTYQGMNPPLVNYSSDGSFPVTLRVDQYALSTDDETKVLTVSTLPAPQITLQVENKQCLGIDNLYGLQSDLTLDTYNWNLGDGTLSGSPTPAHTYAANGSYAYAVVVEATNGCTTIGIGEIIVSGPPDFELPVVAAMCSQQDYDFTNVTPFDAAFEPTWEWRIDGVQVSTDRDLTTQFASQQNGSVELTSILGGCEASTTIEAGPIVDGPAVDFTYEDICEGVATQFTNTSTGDVSSYLWDFGGVTSTDEDPIHTFPAADVVATTLTAFNSSGCQNSKTSMVPIYTVPVANFSLDLPPFSCAGSPSQFHDITTPPSDSNLELWEWAFGDSNTGIGSDPQHTYVLAGPYNVGLVVTTDKGCAGTLTRSVSILPSPDISIDVAIACVDQPTQLTAVASSPVEAWLWKIDNSVYTVQNITHTFATPGDHTIELTATAANDCQRGIEETASVPVEPVFDFTVTDACSGQESQFEANLITEGDPLATFHWNFGGGAYIPGNSTSKTFEQAGVYPVELLLTGQSGCAYSLIKNTTIHLTPTPSFTPSAQYGPAPLTVPFVNTSTGASSYNWQFSDGSGIVTENSPTHTFDALGTYVINLEAIGDSGCSASTGGMVYVIVPYTDLAIDGLSFIPAAKPGELRGAVFVTNNSNYPIVSFDLVMEMGGGVVVTEHRFETLPPASILTVLTNITLTQLSSGYVCTTVQVAGDENTGNDRQCVPINDESIIFEPYPNPSKSTLTIQFVSTEADELEIHLVNDMGADAYSKSVPVVPGFNLFNIDVSNLSQGMYIIKVASSQSTMTRRVMIEK